MDTRECGRPRRPKWNVGGRLLCYRMSPSQETHYADPPSMWHFCFLLARLGGSIPGILCGKGPVSSSLLLPFLLWAFGERVEMCLFDGRRFNRDV